RGTPAHKIAKAATIAGSSTRFIPAYSFFDVLSLASLSPRAPFPFVSCARGETCHCEQVRPCLRSSLKLLGNTQIEGTNSARSPAKPRSKCPHPPRFSQPHTLSFSGNFCASISPLPSLSPPSFYARLRFTCAL